MGRQPRTRIEEDTPAPPFDNHETGFEKRQPEQGDLVPSQLPKGQVGRGAATTIQGRSGRFGASSRSKPPGDQWGSDRTSRMFHVKQCHGCTPSTTRRMATLFPLGDRPGSWGIPPRAMRSPSESTLRELVMEGPRSLPTSRGPAILWRRCQAWRRVLFFRYEPGRGHHCEPSGGSGQHILRRPLLP